MKNTTAKTATALLFALVLTSPLFAQNAVKFGAELEKIDPEVLAIERKLENLKVTLDFEEAGLQEVVGFLREISGVNIILDPSVFERDEEDLQVTLDLKDLTLKSCIDLLLDLKGLKRTYKHGVMIITDPEEVKEDMFFKVYDVRDLMFEIKDFPGPDIALVSDEDGAGGIDIDFGGDDENSNPFSDEDTLLELIETNVDPESWEEDQAALNLRNGLLIITNTRDVHLKLRKFLDQLRAMR